LSRALFRPLLRIAVMASGISAPMALAQDAFPVDANGVPIPSIATSLPGNGDPQNFRKWLYEHGIAYGLTYTNDALANVAGGRRRGFIDQGKLEAAVSVDFGKLAGWNGLTLYSNAFQIHNTGRIRRDYVGGINTIAAIEAVPATRLSELWLEQKFFGDRASIRAGQLTADTEFFFAGLSTMFLQSDWATITAVNLPSGGPAYPLSTPGARLKFDPISDVSLLLAVYNGDPAGPGPGDEQIRNRHGLNFRVNDPPLAMAELQLRANHAKEATGLATSVKLGGWTHFGRFDDQRFASDLTPLANPAGPGVPHSHRGTYGVYGVLEQQLYRPARGEADSGVSIFGRLAFAPSERSLVDFFADGGIVFAGMLPERPHDRFGVSVIYSRFSDGVRAFDRDQINFTGAQRPVRDFEANLEFTYLAQVVPGWTVQPVLTFVFHPNGERGRDAAVVGARSVWRF
jgi:porin